MPNPRKSSRRGVSSPTSYAASKPIAGPDAFQDLTEPSHVLSQAATLLLIGSYLRGDASSAQARAESAIRVTTLTTGALPSAFQALPEEDVKALGFPQLQASSERFRATDLQRSLGVRFSGVRMAAPVASDVRAAAKSLPAAADAFYGNANTETAAALLEAGLRHPNDLVRAAAAASYFEVAAQAAEAIVALESCVGSKDRLTSDVAAYALAHIEPSNPELLKRLRARRKISRRKPSRTSTIVHGTWAADSGWWQPPNGDFWTYLRDNVDPNLYGAQDRFGWSGGYSDSARTKAGTDLNTWVQKHSLNGLDLYCHSHGCSVSMLANHLGTRVGKMVLLSCPVHWPKYTPDFTRVTKVVSVRVHLDLVILADRGGQKFNDPNIEEHVLPIWFDHFATHEPAVWDKYKVKQWVLAVPPVPPPPAVDPASIGAEFRKGLDKPMRVRGPVKLKKQST
jgi:hypothetical protein